MKVFNRIVLTALLSGALAGLVLAGIQHLTVIPMILEAETYETTDSDEGETSHGEEEAWAPEDGAERTFFTAMNSVIVGIGFGLLLTACYAVRGNVTWRKGILWGLAGFAAFHLAPSFGLPPELPGDAAAGLGQRQVWWLITVIVTAVGLWIIAFQKVSYMKLFGVALIILPHLFGAPQPEAHGGLAPEELRNAFMYTTLVTNAIFWIVLGILSAYLFNRLEERAEKTAINAAVS